MKKNDAVFGSIFIALGIFIFTQTYSYPSLEKGHPGPGLFPNLLAVLFIIFGGVLILKAKRRFASKEEASSPVHKKVVNAFFVLGIIGVYVATVDKVGFLVTSAVLLFILMTKLGAPILRSAIASICITLFINGMFLKILRVPLPPGFLGW
ncbi:MAG TPA: tripartite tricarboxylate transporter TctB family protein [Thermodesulfobacteriota bacterium]|nr:tripartite tricarboxylate transporter TctB family protein [Thermodesulfobacteriota bacterium]